MSERLAELGRREVLSRAETEELVGLLKARVEELERDQKERDACAGGLARFHRAEALDRAAGVAWQHNTGEDAHDAILKLKEADDGDRTTACDV